MTLSLSITQKEVEALRSLRSIPKFLAEDFYPGAPTEVLRSEAEGQINYLLDKLIEELPHNPEKGFVLSQFKEALSRFAQSDTEERERFCGYLEEIMDITSIESSDGLLNGWLYGFDPLSP
jgi:Domain of unknown function (DUF4844)